MTKFTMIIGAANINKFVGGVVQRYGKLQDDLHLAAISSLYHASTTGDIRPINRLHDALNSNDKQALRLFIRRAHAIIGLKGENPDGMKAEAVTAAVSAGTVFGFADKQFTIINHPGTDNAKAFTKLSEARFLNPDGEQDRQIFERNNFSEVSVLGDKEVLEKLTRAMKELDAGNTERREVHVSPKTADFIRKVGAQAQTMLEQFKSMDAASDDRKPNNAVVRSQAKAKDNAAKPARAKPRATKADKQAALANKAKANGTTSEVSTH